MSGGTVEYYTIEGVPGRYFKCPKGVGKMSDKACGGFYQEAMSAKGLKDGLRFSCRSCPIGAMHAGVAPLEAAASRFLSQLSCARCVRPANRLIRNLICVSCYNREREVINGRNAKGNLPVRGRAIGQARLHCDAEGQAKIRQLDRVASYFEAVLSVMRAESRSIRFGWAPPAIRKGGGGAATRTVQRA